MAPLKRLRERIAVVMRPEDPGEDDPIMRRVAEARPSVDEEDLSPSGWRARAIRQRVISGSTAPPSRRGALRRPRRGRWTGALVPALGIAATVAVVAVVVISAGSHARRHATTPAGTPTPPPAPASLLPAHGGMRGLLSTPQLVGSGTDLTAIFEQCPRCRRQMRASRMLWASRSADGGRTWRTGRVSTADMDIAIQARAGRAVWATGDLGVSPKILVSHDDGQHFAAAATAATPASQSPLTISDGTVWALGNRCDGHRCRAVVLSGPADGDRLLATATQPALRPHVNGVQAVVGASGSTVVVTGGFAATDLQTFVSHDGGRSWAQVSYPCRRPVEGDVYPTGPQSLWAVCLDTRGARDLNAPESIIRRSTDGGQHWTTSATLELEQPTLRVVDDSVAWINAADGTIERTTNGGRSWQTVLQPPNSLTGYDLAVQDGQTATVLVMASRGSGDRRRTNLVSYRTTDGGARWTPTVVRLPTG